MAKKTKLINIGFIVAALVILLIPLIKHNGIYESVTLSPDMINSFKPAMYRVAGGMPFDKFIHTSPYLGHALTMWVLGKIVHISNAQPEYVYMVYSLIVLFCAGITLYYLGKMVGGARVGWLVLVFALLCNTSILGLFSYACIFNIINVYILFLWAVIFVIKWRESKQYYWLLLSFLLLSLFAVLHPSGMYLPSAVVVLSVGCIVWQLLHHNPISRKYIGVPVLLIIAMIICIWNNANLISWNIGSWKEYGQYLIAFARFILQPITTVICVLVLVGYIGNRKRFQVNSSTKWAVVLLGSVVVALLGASILKVVYYTDRLMVDAGAFVSIIAAIILGRLVILDNTKWLKVSSYSLLSLGSLITLRAWMM